MSALKLSIIVVGFDMARELPRTIQSLSPPYQRDIAPEEIEIIVVDNGSAIPVRAEDFAGPVTPTVLRVDDAGVSPCRAVNIGVAQARAERIAVMVDGARMVTPGLVRTALDASRIRPEAFVATLGLHLGPAMQQLSVANGYTREVEDRLLAGIGWPDDGYRLFEISVLGGSYIKGILVPPYETTFFVMTRNRFDAIGGYDERFRELGGGLAGFDLYNRAVSQPDADLIMILGEATFHQLHYGATTREGGVARPARPDGESLWDAYNREYQAVRGEPYRQAEARLMIHGAITHPAVPGLFFPPDSR